MKVCVSIVAVGAFVAVTSTTLLGQVNSGNQAANAAASVSDVFFFGTQTPVQPASSTLTRTARDVSVTINTSDLTPDNVYTIWWVLFNHPEHCATIPCSAADLGTPAVMASVLWATGRVADSHGQATFTAHLVPGAPEGRVLFGPGLINPKRAEVHNVVRCHNAVGANEATLEEQLTTINAGCVGPCVDVQAAIHLP